MNITIFKSIRKIFLIRSYRYDRLTTLVLAGLISIFFMFNLYFLLKIPPVWSDEALIADSAINFLNNGNFGSGLLKITMPEVEKYGISYPPLFFLLSAYWFKVFGFSIFTFRVLSMVLGFLLVLVFLKTSLLLLEIKKIRWLSQLFLGLITILLLTDETIIKAFHLGRPEVLVVLLGFTSIFLYLKSLEDKIPNRNLYFLVSGFLLGIGFLSHYLAVIFIVSLSLHILICNYRTFLKFPGLYFFTTGLLFPIILWMAFDFQMFLYTFNNLLPRLNYRANSPNWIWVIFSDNTFSMKMICIFYLITFWELIVSTLTVKTKKGLLVLLFLTFSWIFSYIWQAFYAYVFVAVLTYFSLLYLLVNSLNIGKNLTKTKIYSVILIAFITFNIFNLRNMFVQFSGENYSYERYSDILQVLIPEGASVYLSSIPDPYFALKDRNILYEFPVLTTSKEKLEEVLNQVDFIVISSSFERIVAGDVVVPYINKNYVEIKNIGQPNQYKTAVIKLKPKESRISGD